MRQGCWNRSGVHANVPHLTRHETVTKVQQAGGEALGVTADVAKEQSTQAMAVQTLQRFGRIDILVNNAAVYGGLKLTPFDQIPEAEWDQVMVVNVSSDTIWMGVPLFLHYMASKGAAFAFTRALARELSGTGITVNTITPGYTMTEAAQGLVDPETVARIREWVLDQQM
jgi:NAD(P)-dependent dehydrogenase (short-subunit alcohol dehydrogenase family)